MARSLPAVLCPQAYARYLFARGSDVVNRCHQCPHAPACQSSGWIRGPHDSAPGGSTGAFGNHHAGSTTETIPGVQEGRRSWHTPGSKASGRDILQLVRNELVPGDGVVIFPQGRIEAVDADLSSIHHGYRYFEHPSIPTHFTPMALSVEALTHSKPSLFVQVGQRVSCDEAADAFKHTVQELRGFLREHGESADEAWPGHRIR